VRNSTTGLRRRSGARHLLEVKKADPIGGLPGRFLSEYEHWRWLTGSMGRLRRGHVATAMSAFAPIATKLLREGNGRKGPLVGDIAAQLLDHLVGPH
jgi:hypothetical protein